MREDNSLLPLEHYDVLLCLKRAPGGGQRLRLSELAEAVTLSRSGLTRLVDRLEKAGLLRREACPTDRRGAFAALTPKGAGALRRTWPAYARAIQEHFARHLSDEEAGILARASGRILRGLTTPAPEAPPRIKRRKNIEESGQGFRQKKLSRLRNEMHNDQR